MNNLSEYIITALFTKCPRPSRMATKLTGAIKSVATLTVWSTSFAAADTISIGLTR